MSNYKEELYRSYYQTHISPRKGETNEKDLKRRYKGYKFQFKSLLPINNNAKICDLGCGSGSLVSWLQHEGYKNVIGVDASQDQIKAGLTAGINGLRCINIDIYLDQEGNHDCLILRDVLEHFDRQSAFDLLKQCYSALKPGGYLIIQVPNAESPFFGRIRYGDFTHELAFTSSSINQVLNAIGFDNTLIKSVYPLPLNWRGIIRYIFFKAVEKIFKFIIRLESAKAVGIVTQNMIVQTRKAN